MTIWQIIRRLVPFIKPYGRWVALSLGLTFLGALAAQVNPLVLRYTVDTIERLFLKDPPIIFLDEPTASLDAVATEQIKNSLDAIKEERTTVVISHSISQIVQADPGRRRVRTPAALTPPVLLTGAPSARSACRRARFSRPAVNG